MKAQMKVSFLLASFVFVIFIALSSFYFSQSLASIVYDAKLQYARIRAELVADILANEKGIPENWEKNPNSVPVRLGLSNGTAHVLDTNKINALASNCDIFEKSFRILNYRLVVVDEDSTIRAACGTKSGASAHVERQVALTDGKKALILLDVGW